MYTKSEILLEYAKCIEDPIYAIETYFETFDNTREGFVPFRLFPKQKEILKDYEIHRNNLVTKPRQAGISTITQAYMGVKIGFSDPKKPETILIIANKLKLAQKFLKGIKAFVSQLPRWVWGPEYYGSKENEDRPIFATENQSELEMVNGCKVIAVGTREDALRGYTPTYLIFDEAAFVEKGADVYAAAVTSLGTGGKCTLISTPNGMDSLYYKTYDEAQKGRGNYNIIEMKWYQDPRYNGYNDLRDKMPSAKENQLKWVKKGENEGDEDIIVPEVEFTYASYEKMVKDGYKPTSKWYEDMCQSMNYDAKKIAQELDVSFIGSGGNVIHDDWIEFQNTHNVREPKWVDERYSPDGNDGITWIWEEPIEGHQYIMGVDVSRGDGEDYSSVVVIDFTTMEQVLEYQGKIQPDLLAQVVQDYGHKYKAYTVVDITGGMGVATVLKLIEIDYPYLHYDKPSSRVLSRKKDLERYSIDNGEKIPGFNVGPQRVVMVSHLEYMVRVDGIKIRSKRMTLEMKTFIYKNGRPDHMDGYNDDLLMGTAMALFVVEHSFKKLQKAEKQTKAILNSWLGGADVKGQHNSEHKDTYNTGFVAAGDSGKKSQPKPKFSREVSKNMQDPNGDYLWLFSGMR
jgi:hypothetical protein